MLRPNRALKNAIEAEVFSGNMSKISEDKTVAESKTDTEKETKYYSSIDEGNAVQQIVSLSVTSGNDDINEDGTIERHILVSVKPPDLPIRYGSDICCVVDVSGSMQGPATTANQSESNGLAIIDIVRHTIVTIINTLDANDRLALVSYSTRAEVVFDLIPMTDNGKLSAKLLVDNLKADGMTNLWEGLAKGLDTLHNGSKTLGKEAVNAAVILFTDGVPNIEPPRGYNEMLKRYRERCGGKFPGTINTFGFGYSLNRYFDKVVVYKHCN